MSNEALCASNDALRVPNGPLSALREPLGVSHEPKGGPIGPLDVTDLEGVVSLKCAVEINP